MESRRAPVQGCPGHPAGTIPWAVHEAAWRGYAAAGHGSQSAERIAERGGFSYLELQYALAGRYNDLLLPPGRRKAGVLPEVEGWEPQRGGR